jgi:hypothetical protein
MAHTISPALQGKAKWEGKKGNKKYICLILEAPVVVL